MTMGKQSNCVAIDIGASGGRIVIGSLNAGKLSFTPVYQFPNLPLTHENALLWNLENLFDQILRGLHSRDISLKTIQSLGVDTWGVDYVIVDDDGTTVGNSHSYRDERTNGECERFFGFLDAKNLYRKTGIQIQPFNTLFQLEAMKRETKQAIPAASSFLMIPDWFHYKLTGCRFNEFTNMTTTQLCPCGTGNIDNELLGHLNLDRSLFPRLVYPGTAIGTITPKAGTALEGLPIIAPATHDTASAVAAIPAEEGTIPLFISSGTWSLMGAEIDAPINDEKAFRYNFTNEGSVNGKTRFLKNIMGLWILQRIRSELPGSPAFGELMTIGRRAKPFYSLFNPSDSRLLNPENMSETIYELCHEAGEPIPENQGELVRCVYDSLALSYRSTLLELEETTTLRFTVLHIIGGGSRDTLLNQLAANATGLAVHAGPPDATAMGNCMVQFIGQSVIGSISEGRNILRESFELRKFYPRETSGITDAIRRFERLSARDFQGAIR